MAERDGRLERPEHRGLPNRRGKRLGVLNDAVTDRKRNIARRSHQWPVRSSRYPHSCFWAGETQNRDLGGVPQTPYDPSNDQQRSERIRSRCGFRVEKLSMIFLREAPPYSGRSRVKFGTEGLRYRPPSCVPPGWRAFGWNVSGRHSGLFGELLGLLIGIPTPVRSTGASGRAVEGSTPAIRRQFAVGTCCRAFCRRTTCRWSSECTGFADASRSYPRCRSPASRAPGARAKRSASNGHRPIGPEWLSTGGCSTTSSLQSRPPSRILLGSWPSGR